MNHHIVHVFRRNLADGNFRGKRRQTEKASVRNQTLELLRIVAAFGIVLFHARAPLADFGYSGLVVFVALSAYFAGERRKGFAQKILVPWLFWMAIYGITNFAFRGSALPDTALPLAILAGTSPHLWYLPFIFVVTWAIWLIKPHPIAGFAMAILLLTTSPWWREAGLEPPVAQWMQALAAVGIGLALRAPSGKFLVAAVLLVAAMVQTQGISTPYMLGSALLLVAVAAPQMRWSVQPLAECMYGVYLVHVLALGLFNRITGEGTMATVALAFLASCVGVYAARRFIPQSRVVLG